MLLACFARADQAYVNVVLPAAQSASLPATSMQHVQGRDDFKQCLQGKTQSEVVGGKCTGTMHCIKQEQRTS